ncbi:hypothetical protein GGS23DRAFT_387359 [Durotheca rogersii]|uniref:uncharacterized protein n=1 Tax=Durotheca rogersii TaxID=419775 RepID=UPI00221FBF91|nr:uncharacterized protein GGS23DRAFT_387359 [Durotheca rogersii]KAI5857316.1 hypothetical protein GGS23DRAFT_387359 [Durotheca rogersii]
MPRPAIVAANQATSAVIALRAACPWAGAAASQAPKSATGVARSVTSPVAAPTDMVPTAVTVPEASAAMAAAAAAVVRKIAKLATLAVVTVTCLASVSMVANATTAARMATSPAIAPKSRREERRSVTSASSLDTFRLSVLTKQLYAGELDLHPMQPILKHDMGIPTSDSYEGGW